MNKDLAEQPLSQQEIDRLICGSECMMDAFRKVMWASYHKGFNDCHEGWLETI